MKTITKIIENKPSDGDLYKDYKEKLKDETFKQLVDKLNVDSKILMKYTSLLEDSATEYNNCMHCHSLLNCKNKIRGYAYLPKVEEKRLTFNYQSCTKKQKQDKENKFMKNVFVYEQPEEIKRAKLSDIYPEYKERYETINYLKDFIKNFKENNKGLYLHGNFGCGKTYLIAATFNELAKKNVKSAIIFWPEFLRDLKTSFQSDFKEKYDNIKTVPLLLIDDIGAESTTSWSRDEILCPLLQYRMEQHLTTFFTSNLNLKELEKHFEVTKDGTEEIKAGRLIERIKQLSVDIKMNSDNLRK